MVSFSTELFSRDFYNNLRWVTSHNINISEFLPVSQKKCLFLARTERELYHALCVLAGNIPHLIWNKVEQSFLDLGIEQEDIYKYVKVSSENYLQHRAVTGPIVRKDDLTINKNLQVLPADYKEIYKSVLGMYHD